MSRCSQAISPLVVSPIAESGCAASRSTSAAHAAWTEPAPSGCKSHQVPQPAQAVVERITKKKRKLAPAPIRIGIIDPTLLIGTSSIGQALAKQTSGASAQTAIQKSRLLPQTATQESAMRVAKDIQQTSLERANIDFNFLLEILAGDTL